MGDYYYIFDKIFTMKYLALLVVFAIFTIDVSAIRICDDGICDSDDQSLAETTAGPAADAGAAVNASANATANATVKLDTVTNSTWMDVTIDGVK